MTLEIITSDALQARHGFFTRKGGASSGIFAGLNCGAGSSDQQDAVAYNRTAVAAALQVAPDHLISVHQIHSPTVVIVNAPLPGGASKPKADAMVTNQPGFALGILTADCAPILFADDRSGVIGAAHAGWKGALGGVIHQVIARMVELGAERGQIHATVGPCISQNAYEVGPEFLEQFIAEDMAYTTYFANGEDNRYQFNLPLFCLNKLRAEDIGQANWSGHCTYEDAERFFSYRRMCHRGEADYGRQISAITL